MKKVLITGASGFIGKQTLPFLETLGFEVHAATSKTLIQSGGSIHWHVLNLFDEQQIEQCLQDIRPTHLLHLAWDVEHGKFWTSPKNLAWVSASLNLLRAFACHGGKRVVMAGTCAEYDWDFDLCSETTTPFKPASLYGRCKRSLYEIAESFTRQAGISFAWGYIFFLYGMQEHPKRFIPSVIRALLSNQSIPLSHGNQIRDFLDVRDAASAFAALLDSEITQGVNIAAGTPISLKQAACKIAYLLQKNETLLQFGSVLSQANDPPCLAADIGRLRNELHWSPQFSFEEGLNASVDWWKQNL